MSATWEIGEMLVHVATAGFVNVRESGNSMMAVWVFGLDQDPTFFHTLVKLVRKILERDEEQAVRCIEHRLAYLDTHTPARTTRSGTPTSSMRPSTTKTTRRRMR